MLRFLRIRIKGMRLARRIIESIEDTPDRWEIRDGSIIMGGTLIQSGVFSITIVPCVFCPCLRILDTVRLFCHSSDVYLPLRGRLKLRNTARLFSQEDALKKLAEAEECCC